MLETQEQSSSRSRSKDAIIAAIATILAAVIAAAGVIIAASRREQNSLAEEAVTLRTQLASKTREAKTLAQTVVNLQEQVTQLGGIKTKPEPDPDTGVDPIPPEPDDPVAQTATERELTFGLQRCLRSSVITTCRFTIKNFGPEREIRLYVNPGNTPDSRAFDDQGRQRWADGGELAGARQRNLEVVVPANLTVPASIQFRDIPTPVRKFTVLDIFFRASDSYDEFKVTFHDVPVTPAE
jgi:hypothetical protein